MEVPIALSVRSNDVYKLNLTDANIVFFVSTDSSTDTKHRNPSSNDALKVAELKNSAVPFWIFAYMKLKTRYGR